MPGGDITTVFLLGVLSLWAGVLICLRRSLAAKPTPHPILPGLPAVEPRPDHQPGDELDGLAVLGISLVIFGYMVMCYVLAFWEIGLGAAAFFAGFVLIPVVVAWRTR